MPTWRDQHAGDQRAEDALSPAEVELRERVSRHPVEEHGQDRRADGDQQAVAEVAREIEAREQGAVVLERRGARQEPRRQLVRLTGGHERS